MGILVTYFLMVFPEIMLKLWSFYKSRDADEETGVISLIQTIFWKAGYFDFSKFEGLDAKALFFF